jgi:DNA polymerase III gamma/tau subunit
VSNVLPPILSRCYACHFKPVERTDALALMASICAAEGVPHTPDVLTTAYDTLRGDLRACLTTIQAVYHMHRRVSVALLEEQLGSVAADVWDTVCACKSAKDVRAIVDNLHREGQSVRRLLQALVAWSLSNCPADQVRALGPMASRMERQALFQTDARLLLHELVLTVWLVCGQGVTVSRGGST